MEFSFPFICEKYLQIRADLNASRAAKPRIMEWNHVL